MQAENAKEEVHAGRSPSACQYPREPANPLFQISIQLGAYGCIQGCLPISALQVKRSPGGVCMPQRRTSWHMFELAIYGSSSWGLDLGGADSAACLNHQGFAFLDRSVRGRVAMPPPILQISSLPLHLQAPVEVECLPYLSVGLKLRWRH